MPKAKVSKARPAVIYLQKRAVTLEVVTWNRRKEIAETRSFLGELNIDEGMLVTNLVGKLERLVQKLKEHKGDIFIVQ